MSDIYGLRVAIQKINAEWGYDAPELRAALPVLQAALRQTTPLIVFHRPVPGELFLVGCKGRERRLIAPRLSGLLPAWHSIEKGAANLAEFRGSVRWIYRSIREHCVEWAKRDAQCDELELAFRNIHIVGARTSDARAVYSPPPGAPRFDTGTEFHIASTDALRAPLVGKMPP